MHRLLAILAFAGCDAGARVVPHDHHRGSDAAVRPIDAHIVEMDGPTGPSVEPIAAVILEPLAARPASWEHIETAHGVPELELGLAHGTYTLIAKQGSKLYSADVSSGADGVVVDSFQGGNQQAHRAALLVFDENHDGGKVVELVACGVGASQRWSCTSAIELQRGDLRDDLAYKLVTHDGMLELQPLDSAPPRRLAFTFP